MRKMTFLLTAMLMCSCMWAQDTASLLFRLDHLALSVTNVDRSAEFYGQLLQLPEISNRTKMAGIRWFALGEEKELHLISTVKERVVSNKAVHLALTTARFDAFVAMLERRKIAYSDWAGKPQTINLRADGIRQVFFQDPDGYWIEVNSVKQQE